MIYFYCPECKEELEAEDGIRGQQMKCPACWKDIAVPMAGVRMPGAKKPSRAPARERVPEGGAWWGLSRGFLVTVGILSIAVVVGLLIGLFAYRSYMVSDAARGPKCSACVGTGKAVCPACKASREEPCTNKECQGGKITNFRGEEETCLTCGGRTRIACRACAGTGAYGCPSCQGTGRHPTATIVK